MKHLTGRIRDFVIIVVIPAIIGLIVALVVTAQAEAQTTKQKTLGRCVLVVDAATGEALHRDGDCAVRRGPQSTFKIPLAVMGFETGVLRDAHDPAWAYDGSAQAPERDRKTVDPAIWERDSVVWFSRELVKRMAARDGANVLGDWLARLDYGNRDASGDPGKNNGLTDAWLDSSIGISPEEQIRFLRQLLGNTLPVSARAQAMTREIIPVFSGADGWTVHGKTGSTGHKPTPDGAEERGWFVGWAEKDGRRVVFAVHEHSVGAQAGQYAGPRLREWMLAHLGGLAR